MAFSEYLQWDRLALFLRHPVLYRFLSIISSFKLTQHEYFQPISRITSLAVIVITSSKSSPAPSLSMVLSYHFPIFTKLSESLWNKTAKSRILEALREYKPPPSDHFYFWLSCGPLGRSAPKSNHCFHGVRFTSRKFHQNSFIHS